MLTHADRAATDILGAIDAMKFRSCLTLFATVAPEEHCFSAALEAFYLEPRPASTSITLSRTMARTS